MGGNSIGSGSGGGAGGGSGGGAGATSMRRPFWLFISSSLTGHSSAHTVPPQIIGVPFDSSDQGLSVDVCMIMFVRRDPGCNPEYTVHAFAPASLIRV